jgi:tripartite-type tricarboxylate transporter receptor subunit TctC
MRIRVLGLLIAQGLAWASAQAQSPAQPGNFPSRTVTIIVPFSPGGGTDISARMIAKHLTEATGRPFVVENKPGANGNIGADIVARAAPDGYTLMMGGTSTAVNASMFRKLPFDTLKSFVGVSIIAVSPTLLAVHSSVPANTIQELIALAKSKPGTLNFASGGVGTGNHLAGELFKHAAGVDIVHIPYKGGGPAMNDVIAGHIPIIFGSMSMTLKQVEAGRLRALATTGPARSNAAPTLPSVGEAGLAGAEFLLWYGLLAPAGTQKPIRDYLAGQVSAAIAKQEVRQSVISQGADPLGNSADEADQFFRKELERWIPVVKAANLYAD